MSGTFADTENPATYQAYIVGNGGIDRILDRIMVEVSGVTLPVVTQTLWDSVQDFCLRSVWWRRWVAWDMPAGIFQTTLDPAYTGAEVARVLAFCGLNGVQRLFPPATVFDPRPQNPSLERSGTALVLCRPQTLASTPSLITDQHSEALSEGALARLYQMPKRPWSDKGQAELHARRFRGLCVQARADARSFNEGNARLFPYFAGGNQNTWVVSSGDSYWGGQGGCCPPPDPAYIGLVLPIVSITLGGLVGTPVVSVSGGTLTTTGGNTGSGGGGTGGNGGGSPPALTPGVVSATSSAVNYPATPVGTAETQTITFTNTGESSVTITAITAGGDFTVGNATVSS
jgi:hypothetical protein